MTLCGGGVAGACEDLGGFADGDRGGDAADLGATAEDGGAAEDFAGTAGDFGWGAAEDLVTEDRGEVAQLDGVGGAAVELASRVGAPGSIACGGAAEP